MTETAISIHAPTNGATFFIVRYYVTINDFNPRSDERSDDEVCRSLKYSTNFNPRSDERSDLNAYSYCLCDTISIHAPTNGATFTYIIIA